MPLEFISEDDLKTFEGWLKYQAVDPSVTTPHELGEWRGVFDDVRNRSAATPKVGLMKLRPLPGEYRYAVAIREAGVLWLALWIRRSRKGEFFVLLPSGNSKWNFHTSYHVDGTFHTKSFGAKSLRATKRQPLSGPFRGNETLGAFFGYAPKSVGAICDPTAFSGIVKVAPSILGPQDGGVLLPTNLDSQGLVF